MSVAQDIIKNHVEELLKTIRKKRQKTKIKALIQWSRDLHSSLIDAKIPLEMSYLYTEDSVRFVKQYLADIGMHGHAFALAKRQNEIRTNCHRELGNKLTYWIGRANNFVHGYTLSWLKVLRSVAIIFLMTCLSLLSFWFVSGEHAIIFTNNSCDSVSWYHYPYFTLVTFATLGYGDLAPNIDVPYGMIPAYIASVSAVFGIITLGLFLAILVNRLGAHSIVRASKWFDDYENAYRLSAVKYYESDTKDPGENKGENSNGAS